MLKTWYSAGDTFVGDSGNLQKEGHSWRKEVSGNMNLKDVFCLATSCFFFSIHHKLNSILLYLPYHHDDAKEPWTKTSEMVN